MDDIKAPQIANTGGVTDVENSTEIRIQMYIMILFVLLCYAFYFTISLIKSLVQLRFQ